MTATKAGLDSFYDATDTYSFSIIENTGYFNVGTIPAQVYTGSAITPALTVMSGGTANTPGTDYTVSCSHNTNVGTATATVKGTGDYEGYTRTKTFTISPRQITFNVDPMADYTYSGAEIKPVVKVYDGSKLLSEGTDYTVVYSADINVGRANVSITGKGNYAGSSAGTSFNIVAAQNTHLVTFLDGNGDVIQSSNISRTGSVTFPPDPYMYGYTFTGWDKDSAAIQTIAGDVVVRAQFSRNSKTYTIEVNGTAMSKPIMDYVTVTGDAAQSGEKFAYWKGSKGNIVCYGNTYKFYASYDKEITAVYVDQNQAVVQSAGIIFTAPDDNVAGKVTFISERVIPYDCSVVSHGIIITDNAETGASQANFIIGGTGVLQGTANTTGLVGTYILDKWNVRSGETWYARGYVIYKDGSGKETILYSPIISRKVN